MVLYVVLAEFSRYAVSADFTLWNWVRFLLTHVYHRGTVHILYFTHLLYSTHTSVWLLTHITRLVVCFLPFTSAALWSLWYTYRLEPIIIMSKFAKIRPMQVSLDVGRLQSLEEHRRPYWLRKSWTKDDSLTLSTFTPQTSTKNVFLKHLGSNNCASSALPFSCELSLALAPCEQKGVRRRKDINCPALRPVYNIWRLPRLSSIFSSAFIALFLNMFPR